MKPLTEEDRAFHAARLQFLRGKQEGEPASRLCSLGEKALRLRQDPNLKPQVFKACAAAELEDDS